MYILALDRANLIRLTPQYQAVLVNENGEIIFFSDHLNRNALKALINNKLIKDLAVWSYTEFNLISRLTDREIIILKELFRNRNHIRISDENYTLKYLFEKSDFPAYRRKSPKKIPKYEWIYNKDKSRNEQLSLLLFRARILVTVFKT